MAWKTSPSPSLNDPHLHLLVYLHLVEWNTTGGKETVPRTLLRLVMLVPPLAMEVH